jgi:hypothetical protein
MALTHNMSRTIIYSKWRWIVNRCKYRKWNRWERYAWRWINVCERWLKFENFYEDMWEAYIVHLEQHWAKNTQIDRIDNDGDYCKENCKWSTVKEQALNRCSNRLITFKGLTQTLSQWAEELWIKRSTITQRIDYYWWSTEKALST